MDYNAAMERALAQARQVQQQVGEALSVAAEQLKPQLQKSLDDAKDLQSTFVKHAEAGNAMASEQAQTAVTHLNDFIRMGSEAMRESAEQTRQTAQKMMEESRKVVEAAAAATKERQ